MSNIDRPNWGDGEYAPASEPAGAPGQDLGGALLPSRIDTLTEADIGHIMRTSYHQYWDSPEMQKRHLALIEERLGERETASSANHAGLRTVTEIRRELESLGTKRHAALLWSPRLKGPAGLWSRP